MRRRFWAAVFFLLMGFCLWGEGSQPEAVAGEVFEAGFFGGLSTGTGVMSGVTTERLYWLIQEDNLYNISWLTWDKQPVWNSYISFNTNLSLPSGWSFFIQPFFYKNIFYNAETGFMQDYDATGLDGRLTDYSKHVNHVVDYVSAGFNSSFFYRDFGLGIGFEYEHQFFKATGGYIQHKSDSQGHFTGYWSENMPITGTINSEVTVITYEVKSFYWRAGILWKHVFGNRLRLGVEVWVYPYRYNLAEDKHYNGDSRWNYPCNYWIDEIEECFNGYSCALTSEYLLHSKTYMNLNIRGVYLPVSIGIDYSKESLEDTYLPSKIDGKVVSYGGMEEWSITVEMGLTFYL